jgi:hypothetical protein
MRASVAIDDAHSARIERQRKKQEVAFGENAVERGRPEQNLLPGYPIRLASIAIEDSLRLEPTQPFGDRSADRAHSDDPNRGAGKTGAIEDGAPAGVTAAPNESVPRGDVARQRDGKADRELRGRRRQEVRHDGMPDAAPGAGGDIKVVVPLQGSSDDLQSGAGGEKIVGDVVGHERDERVRFVDPTTQLRPRPCMPIGVRHHDETPLSEKRHHFWMDPIGYHHFRVRCAHSLGRRSEGRDSIFKSKVQHNRISSIARCEERRCPGPHPPMSVWGTKFARVS